MKKIEKIILILPILLFGFFGITEIIAGGFLAEYLKINYFDATTQITGKSLPYEKTQIIFTILLFYFISVISYVLINNKLKSIKFSVCVKPNHQKYYQVAFSLFIFSLVCNVVTIIYLLKTNSLDSIAKTRAIFTDEASVFDNNFSYALFFAAWVKITAPICVVLSYNKTKYNQSIICCILVAAILVIYGGRTQIIVFTLLTGLAIYIKKGQQILKTVIQIFAFAFVFLFTTMLMRYGTTGTVDRVSSHLLSDRRYQQLGFAIRDFPTKYPFYFGKTLTSGYIQMVPGLTINYSANLYRDMTRRVKGEYYKFEGRGGSNFSTCSELYMNFGLYGIIFILPLLILIFYLLIRASKLSFFPPIYLLFLSHSSIIFAFGIGSKIQYATSEILLTSFIPCALINLLNRNNKSVEQLFIVSLLVIFAVLVKRITKIESIQYVQLISILLFYSLLFRKYVNIPKT